MKKIIEILSSRMFPISSEDEQTYAKLQREFAAFGCPLEQQILFSNLYFLLYHKGILDRLLQYLEADVREKWMAEAADSTVKLNLHEPRQYVDQCGLSWPFPTEELAENHSRHLLSRVLLKMEQKHGLNAGEGPDSPIPTFMGFVPEELSKFMLEQNKLWNEENKLAGFFYHGKMTHRIQFYLIMKAIDLGWLDVDDMSVSDIIKLLTTVHAGNTSNIFWNIVLDDIVTNYNIFTGQTELHSPLTVLPVKQAKIQGNDYRESYVFGNDPYFLHSYLMTASRRHTPYLSECVTQMFVKSAFAIQKLERKIGWKSRINDYVINHRFKRKYSGEKLSEAELTMEQVMLRQAYCFAASDYHYLALRHIKADRKERGKKTDEYSQLNVEFRHYPEVIETPAPLSHSWFQFFAKALPVAVAAGVAVAVIRKY